MPDAPVLAATRSLVLGTAGHIDHGKTSLVRALTGVDCDRYAEEKLRGITIDIGFARWLLPATASDPALDLAVIDVPGHARFIRNMVAGAVGIDILMLVVAADDGVMPQTVEHLQIARLLGIRCGLVALNKADLVDVELLELARADVQRLLAGSFLADAPIIPVSALSGLGLDALADALREQARRVEAPPAGGPFRLPIDRAFSIHGAGTVVTGTVASGTVRVDDELVILPGGQRFKNEGRVRVRGLQEHGEARQSIGPRQRAALNIVGVDKDELSRGDVLCTPDALTASTRIDVRLELLPGGYRPLRSGSWLLLHIGTAELGAKLVPLDQPSLAPGTEALAQLRLEGEVAVAAGDRFILRSAEGDATVGGGVVLDAHPAVHRRQRDAAAQQLRALEGAGSAGELRHELEKTPYGASAVDISRRLAIGGTELEAAASDLAASPEAGLLQHSEGRTVFFTLAINRQRILGVIESLLTAWHTGHQLSARGLGSADLAAALGPELSSRAGQTLRLPAATLEACFEAGLASGSLRRVDDTFAMAAHKPLLPEKELRAAEALVAALEQGLQPPQPEEQAEQLGIRRERLRPLLSLLLEQKRIVLAPGGLYFGAAAVARARQQAVDFLRGAEGQASGLSVSAFNQLVGTSRKFGLPLLQLFENEGLLKRDGDLRRLKG